MQGSEKNVLQRMLAHGVLTIDQPAFGRPLPVSFCWNLLECMPFVRESVVSALHDRLVGTGIEALASVPEGGNSVLVAVLAHVLQLPCIFPTTASASEAASVMLYGPRRESLSGLKVGLVQAYARNRLPLQSMAYALGTAGCELRKYVVLLEADVEGQIRNWLGGRSPPVEYHAIFTLDEIFRTLKSDPDFSSYVASDVLVAAEAHDLNALKTP